MWYDTKGASPSNSVHVPASQQRDSIQELCQTKVYLFDDANAYFTKNREDGFLKCLLLLQTIFCHCIFDIRKTTIEMLEACIQRLHHLQKAEELIIRRPGISGWKMKPNKKVMQ